jgi:hypothetical protein
VYVQADNSKIGFLSIWKRGIIEFFFDQLINKLREKEIIYTEILEKVNNLSNTQERAKRPHVDFGIFDDENEFQALKNIINDIKLCAIDGK